MGAETAQTSLFISSLIVIYRILDNIVGSYFPMKKTITEPKTIVIGPFANPGDTFSFRY